MVGERDPESLISPDIQLDSIIQDCVKKNKRIVRVASDINRTGRTFRKRSVDQIITDIKNGIAKSVTLWKWSRWGRNVEYSKAYLGKVKAVGGRVDAATEDFDQNTAIGRLSQGMIMQFDEFQSDLIGEGWQAAHKKRRADGLPHSGRRRFGYGYISRAMTKTGNAHEGSGDCEQCRTGVPHFLAIASEGPELARLYERYVAGVGFKKLARDLNEAGFRTPLGGPWTSQAVGQMLDTGFAAGYIRERSPELLAQHKSRGKAVRNTLRSFDVWRKGTHPAIISEATWEAYKRRRLEQADLPPRSRSAVHPLSTLMFCGICSRRLVTQYTGRNRQHQWVCGSRDTFHKDVHVSISNAAALAIVRAWLVRHEDPDGRVNVDEMAKQDLKAGNRSTRTTTEIQSEINAELRAVDKLLLRNLRDQVTDEQFAIAKAELEDSIARLRTELDKANAGPAGKPSYRAFRSLDEEWDGLVAGDGAAFNAALRTVLAFVIISPSAGRLPKNRPEDRVEVVGEWERSSKDRWLWTSRRRFSA